MDATPYRPDPDSRPDGERPAGSVQPADRVQPGLVPPGDPGAPGARVAPGELTSAAGDAAEPAHLAKWLVLYTAMRFAVLIVLALGLYLAGLPLIVALAFAIALALPVSWLLLSPMRKRVTRAMAIASAGRRAERDRLRAALDGRDGQ